MSLDFDKLRNQFLRRHLDYVEMTEPPKLFHTWSALAAVGACMGRHVWLAPGIGER